jgi:glycosyltransferase involved in cell wall biosynthesis
MKNVLVLTTDLPFFPGKNGHDFFNLRFLAENNRVGVVAPCYDSHPADGVANLERAVQHVYLWPRPVESSPHFVEDTIAALLPKWVSHLPKTWRLNLLRRLLGIHGQPDVAYERLAILANCAPHLLKAFNERPWEAVVLIQTSIVPWFNFLPRFGAKILYFHDVRSDYLSRSGISSIGPSPSVRSVQNQEQIACTCADAVGFVSDLDRQRAANLLKLPLTAEIAPIPLDTDYFKPRPPERPAPQRKIVLFTGHLRHPPNVDAVLYFLRQIWPLVLAAAPDTVFQAVGLTPDLRLADAIKQTVQAELHANVPDIRPYFWDAAVYVVPHCHGTYHPIVDNAPRCGREKCKPHKFDPSCCRRFQQSGE